MTCDVEGDPFPDVVWHRPDGAEVRTDFTFATADTSTLVGITADYSLHHGSWKVKAVSYNTTASVSVQVTVLRVTTQSTTATTAVGSKNSVNPSNNNNNSNNSSNNNNNGNNGNNNNINNNINYASKPTPSPGGLPVTYPGGKHVSQKLPASVGPGTRWTNGNFPAFPITALPSHSGGVKLSKPKSSETGSGGTTRSVGGRNDNTKVVNNISSEDSIDHSIIVLVAIISGAVVCIVGMTLFALTVYKIRHKRQIHARRRRPSADLYR